MRDLLGLSPRPRLDASRRAARIRLFVLTASIAVVLLPPVTKADDPMPVIVTYELSRLRKDAYAEARDPKGFWIGRIVARIEDKKPTMSTRLKEPVTVQVSFVVAHDGTVLSKKISHSSGNPSVDGIAIDMLDKASPFPPMPAILSDSQIVFTLPLRFN